MESSRQLAAKYWCLHWETLICHEIGLRAGVTVLYRACLVENAGFTWRSMNLCLLSAETDELERARGFIEQAIEVDPSSGVAHEMRARQRVE